MTGEKLVRWTAALFCMLLVCASHAPAQEVPGGQSGSGDVQAEIPSGQEAPEGREIGAEVFGREGGYIHPFLFLEGKYTDNLYYTHTDEEDDFITSVAPGFWIAVPGNREKLLEARTTPTSVSGLQVSRMKPQSNRRMQAYFLYSPEVVYYSDNSEHDHISHRAEAMFQYNFDMGLSVDVMDLFNDQYQINNNATRRLDEYYDNLANIMLTYDPSDKFRFRLDYSNYWLDYDENVNDFRDRTDNSVSLYAFYQLQPKTSVFAEYAFADIRYDTNDLFDSEEFRYYVGLDWDVTAKSRGRVKLGYMEKDFDSDRFSDESGFSAELQAQHTFTPKRSATLTAYHRYTESSVVESYAVLTTGVDFSLMQRFTDKWSATVNALWYRDEFEGDYTVGDEIGEREDDTFRIGPALIYEPRDWLQADLGYYYSNRDSDFERFDFENNTLYFSVEIAL